MLAASPVETDLLGSSLSDPTMVFLDGFHAVKHAARFRADIRLVVCTSGENLREMCQEFAPDIADRFADSARLVRRREIEALGLARAHSSGVWGVARRPAYSVEAILAGDAPVILLENPKNRGNVGACIRVAAAAHCAGVLVTGDVDIWSPTVTRGAAGLQFAIPVAKLSEAYSFTRPIVAVDPGGQDMGAAVIPDRPLFAFGTERQGLSDWMLDLASVRLRVPMRDGVSSLNLAVAAGIVLYSAK
jgi:TrmH family RNA methyltransferase